MLCESVCVGERGRPSDDFYDLSDGPKLICLIVNPP